VWIFDRADPRALKMSAISATAPELRVNEHLGGCLEIPNNCLRDMAVGVKAFTSPDIQQMLIGITTRVSSHRSSRMFRTREQESQTNSVMLSQCQQGFSKQKIRESVPGSYYLRIAGIP
jgi:hypothetical protein